MAQAPRTRWGGIVDRRVAASGFFRLELIEDTWWLVDPAGGRFMSKGVNTVRFDQDRIQGTDRVPYAEACERKYRGQDAWRTAAARRLRSWGFNSLGAWSDEAVGTASRSPLGRTPTIDLGAGFLMSEGHRFQGVVQRAFPDVFDLGFEPFARTRANEACGPSRRKAGVIGWFIDNEPRWGPDWRGPEELLILFLNQSRDVPGRRAADAFLRDRYAAFEGFNAVWKTPARSWEEFGALTAVAMPSGTAVGPQPPSEGQAAHRHGFDADCEAFAGVVAQRYFAASVAAVKAADPNHLVLGCRFGIEPRRSVIEAAGRHLDAISFNCYALDPRRAFDAYAATGGPCMVSEFSFRGDDAGLPNTRGAGPRVPAQADRARSFARYATAALERAECIGYHWFEHSDQPAEGRFDGENSNYGVVTINDDVYLDLTGEMKALNARAEAIHAVGDGRNTAPGPVEALRSMTSGA